MDNLHKVLKEYWGFEQFRELQEDIIRSVMNGNDTLGLMPTGGGKSLTFQVPTMCLEGICIVVTPLIALMKDQVENLRQKKIKAATIYSGMTVNGISTTLDNCYYDNYKFLYVSPERLGTEMFINKVCSMKVCLIAVDESHCISQWGYNFRPSYLKIAKIRDYLPKVPILALTASATPEVVKDIQTQLKFKKENVFRKSFERNNLAYIVRNTDEKLSQLLNILNKVEGSSIVYVRSRKKTKEIADLLNQNDIPSDIFHAGMSTTEKDKHQRLWMENKIRVIVATNAFGMGIDKPNVRTVIHLDLPDSLEAYFQEAGRAGRDGKKSYAILLYNDSDDAKIKKRQKDSYPPIDFIRTVYEKLAFYFTMGMGCGENCIFPFNLVDFCSKYHLPFQPTFNALKILESAGFIILTEESDDPSRLMIMEKKYELYHSNINNSTHKLVLQAVLRLYSGIFSQYEHINEDLIAHYIKGDRQSVYDSLISLSKTGIISYIPAKKTPFIIYNCNRIESKKIKIPTECYETRKNKYIKHTTEILAYAKETEKCRSKMLMHYFGQETADDCGQCDVCIEKKRRKESVRHSLKTISQIITDNLQQKSMSIEEILAAIKDYRSDEIIETMRIMADENLIESKDERWVLKISHPKNKKEAPY